MKNNCKTTVSNCGFKGNCKTTVCKCGFKATIENNCKTTVRNCGFMVVLIKKYFKNNIKIITPLKWGRLKIIVKP